MLKLVIILLCCGLYQSTFAQEIETTFLENDKVGQSINKSFESTSDVANYYHTNSSNENDRIKGIYSWVTRNIRYDKTGTYALNNGPDKRSKIDVAFTRRKGVCVNFSAIFHDICQKAGFRSFVIEGVTKMNHQIVNGAHSWVAVQIKEEWYLFDPTWDAGGGTVYFMVAPEKFIATHIPFDPLWQFLTYPDYLSMNQKEKRTQQNTAPFNYRDSLTAWMQMDSIGKLESVERRILHTASQNHHAKTNLNVVKMNLEIERQGEQVAWHDQATTILNEAVGLINQFNQSRNDLSLLQKPDGGLKQVLEAAYLKIDIALSYLDKIDQSKATLIMGTWPERERITRLKNNLSGQQEFLSKYLSTALAERKKLFYK